MPIYTPFCRAVFADMFPSLLSFRILNPAVPLPDSAIRRSQPSFSLSPTVVGHSIRAIYLRKGMTFELGGGESQIETSNDPHRIPHLKTRKKMLVGERYDV